LVKSGRSQRRVKWSSFRVKLFFKGKSVKSEGSRGSTGNIWQTGEHKSDKREIEKAEER